MAQDPDEMTRPFDAGGFGATASSSTSDTERIRSQIEETRAAMSETIDAIETRLSPRRLMTHAKETVKGATVGRITGLAQRARHTAADLAAQSSETGASVIHAMRNHLVPTALVGLATTWLIVRLVRGRSTGARVRARSSPQRRDAPGGHTLSQSRARLLTWAASGAACWGVWKARQLKRDMSMHSEHIS
jgi:Protein of unknown function (DUF3618)